MMPADQAGRRQDVTYRENIQREVMLSANRCGKPDAHHAKLCRYWVIATGDRALARRWKREAP